MTEDLYRLSIVEASNLLRTKKLSPVELAKYMLGRISALDPLLNTFIHINAEDVLTDAAHAETEIMHGRWRGPLHGIPIGIKDLIDVRGMPTTAYSATFKGRVADTDAYCVARIRKAGAIILGKQSTWELGIGGSSFDLPWPPARNPWDRDRDPSGSSSGPAAAIASGLCMGAIGTDTGGSIRGPAAWCGVAGLKPTFGCVSRSGVVPFSGTMDTVGPLAWTADDCALMMEAMAGHDPRDSQSLARADGLLARSPTVEIRDLKFGVPRHFFDDEVPAGPEIHKAFEASVEFLVKSGAKVKDVTLEPFSTYIETASHISPREGFEQYGRVLADSPHLFAARTRERIATGAGVSAEDYEKACQKRKKLTADLDGVLEDVDVLILPTACRTAGPLGEDTFAPGFQPFYNRPFNVTGNPALAVCNGFSSDGLPLSLQIVGRHFEDNVVLAVGSALEKHHQTRTRRPAIAERDTLS